MANIKTSVTAESLIFSNMSEKVDRKDLKESMTIQGFNRAVVHAFVSLIQEIIEAMNYTAKQVKIMMFLILSFFSSLRILIFLIYMKPM